MHTPLFPCSEDDLGRAQQGSSNHGSNQNANPKKSRTEPSSDTVAAELAARLDDNEHAPETDDDERYTSAEESARSTGNTCRVAGGKAKTALKKTAAENQRKWAKEATERAEKYLAAATNNVVSASTCGVAAAR